jgi:hypothetical protein
MGQFTRISTITRVRHLVMQLANGGIRHTLSGQQFFPNKTSL